MLADRVKESSTSTGTGAFSLAGAATGFRSFASGIGDGNKCHYVIENASVPGEWEIGVGTVSTTPDQLSRDTVLSSSNAGSAVDFSAGAKSVYVSAVANSLEAALTDALGSVSGSVTLKVNHYQAITATIGGATTFSFDGWPSAGTPFRSLILTNGGSAAITWPTMTWVDGAAPTLQTTGVDRIDIWRTGGVVYGKLVKQAASSGGVTATVTLADNVTVGDFVAALNSGSVEKVKETVVATSAGTPSVFESANSSFISAAYDSAAGKVVIAYSDGGNGYYGTAIVGTVSGTSISFGTAVVFESAYTEYISAAYDSAAGKVVIAYRDVGNSNYGTAIVGTVSGTTISFGTAIVFENADSTYISAAYDSAAGKVVIAYRDNGNGGFGTAIIGTVSGTSISFGTAVIFESANSSFISAACDSATGKVVIAYSDGGNGYYGTAIVGTVSGTSISFGTAVVFESASSTYISAAYDTAAGKIIIAYSDVGNGNYGTAIVGTVSGTTISFGTAVVFESARSDYISAAYDSAAGKVVIAYSDGGNGYYGTAIVGTVSGTSISFGTAVVFESASSAYISAAYDTAAGKIIIAYRDVGGSFYGTAVTFTVGGTTTNSSDVIGVATETKSSGQTCAIIPMGAVDTTPTGLSVGQDYYITGAGVRTTTAGANVYVGRAVASNQLLLRGIAKR
jgi:hypothetical protein